MNPRIASFLAILFCAAVLLVVSRFGYSRYRKAQAEDAAFSHALILSEQQPAGALKAKMPSELAPHTSTVASGVPAPH